MILLVGKPCSRRKISSVRRFLSLGILLYCSWHLDRDASGHGRVAIDPGRARGKSQRPSIPLVNDVIFPVKSRWLIVINSDTLQQQSNSTNAALDQLSTVLTSVHELEDVMGDMLTAQDSVEVRTICNCFRSSKADESSLSRLKRFPSFYLCMIISMSSSL
jgi:hypothetical protein